ncbi:MAG: lipid II:glycine glycyltransferase FemX [Spirochaetia bacterium]
MEISVQHRPMPVAKNFLQSPFWANFKGQYGWKSMTFEASYYGGHFQFLVLLRRFVKFFTLAYVPLPAFEVIPEEEREEFLQSLSQELQAFLPMGTVFLRWDLPWSQPLSTPFACAKMSIQPPSTTILNLTLGTNVLLANMHKKTRYNIGLAEKRGVRIERAGFDEVSKWYRIYQQTAQRDGIAIHSLDYYQKFFYTATHTTQGPEARLYLAWHEEDLLAGIIVLFYQGHATYVYGASSSIKRNLMANYLLQWRAISDAWAAGCVDYDFYGIPPAPDPDHPMIGLYQFKVGFGGDLIHRCGAWDFPFSRLFYPIFSFVEAKRATKLKANKPVHKTAALPEEKPENSTQEDQETPSK